MNEYRFDNEDKFIGFMTALQIVGVGWEVHDEDIGLELLPITDKDIQKYKEGIVIKFGSHGINWGGYK